MESKTVVCLKWWWSTPVLGFFRAGENAWARDYQRILTDIDQHLSKSVSKNEELIYG